MDLLIEAGLFGQGLVRIDTPDGVSRYNEALQDLGVEPTKLASFQIDGIGWSPEIAAEKGNKKYLTHGDANQIGIIASPDQYKMPVHFPSNSFDRRLMKSFFERSMREIGDITTTTCIRLDLEQNILAYDSPRDLMYLDAIVVCASAGKLIEEVGKQKLLATEFMEGNAWLNPELRYRIIESAKVHGDLRRRHTEIPNFSFSLIGNFWTRAFGGAFVFRSGGESILMLEDKSLLDAARPGKDDRGKVFALSQKRELVEHLLSEDLIELNPDFYKRHPKELETLRDMIVADCVCRVDPECDFSSLSKSKQKGIIVAHRHEMPDVLLELERLMKVVAGKDGKVSRDISEELSLLLYRPTNRIVGAYRDVVWMLLQRLQDNPFEILRLYTYDKERFFSFFEKWSSAKKKWAAHYVKERYEPRMNQQ